MLLGKTNIGAVRSQQALKANKLHHKGIIYHQKTCDRILIVSFFEIYLQVQNSTQEKSFMQEQQRKAGKLQYLSIFNKEGNEICASLP